MIDTPEVKVRKKMIIFERFVAAILANGPHLPQKMRNIIADGIPLLSLIYGIGGIFSTAMWSYFLFMGLNVGEEPTLFSIVNLCASAAVTVLRLKAWSPLFARQKSGWNYLLCSVLFSTLAIPSSLAPLMIWGIFSAIICLWLLFEIKGAYN